MKITFQADTLAKLLRLCRQGAAMSQLTVARRARIHETRYWRFEAGFASPTAEELVQIAKVVDHPRLLELAQDLMQNGSDPSAA